jgi:hypothetical protein
MSRLHAIVVLLLVLMTVVAVVAVVSPRRRTVVAAPASTPTSPAVPTPTATTVAPTVPLVDGVAFLGDSLADNLGAGLAVAASRRGLRVFNDAISGCGVARSGAFRLAGARSSLSPVCAAWPDTWAERLMRDRPKVVAIQVGRHEVLDRMFEGRWTNILDDAYAAYVRSELVLAVRVARRGGARAVLLTSPSFRPSAAPENDPARVARFNGLLRELVAGDPDLVLIDLGGHVSPGGAYASAVDGVTVRSDGVHFSRSGVVWIGEWLLPQLGALVAR